MQLITPRKSIALPGRDFPYPKPKREAITAFGFGHSMPFKGTPSTVSSGGGGGWSGDPFYQDVTLLVPATLESQFDDHSKYAHSSTQTGAIALEINAESFSGYSIRTPGLSTANYREYLYNNFTEDSGTPFTIEFFAQIVTANGIGSGYSFSRGIYALFGNTSADNAIRFAAAGLVSNANNFNFQTPTSQTNLWADAGLATGYARHHVALVYDGAGDGSVFVNGYFFCDTAVSTVIANRVRLGSLGSTVWMSTYLDNIRITNGVMRYIRPQGSIVDTFVFTPPTTSFYDYGPTTSLRIQYVNATTRVPIASGTDIPGTTMASIQDADVLLAVVMARSTLTAPAGWTLEHSESCSGSGITQTVYIYSKDVVTVADSSAVITFTQAISNVSSIGFIQLRTATGEFEVIATGENSLDDTAASSIAIPVLANDVGVSVFIVAASQITGIGVASSMSLPTYGYSLISGGNLANSRLNYAYAMLGYDQSALAGDLTALSSGTGGGIACAAILVRAK